MAKLPTQKKILREDLKEAPAWIDKLLTPINSFFESIYSALSKNITFSENIACQVKEIEFTAPAAWTTDTYLRFARTIKTRATGAWVIQITDVTSDNWTPIANAVTLDWQDQNAEIVVGKIAGLTTGNKYLIRLVII